MEIRRFDRQENMSSEVRNDILQIIRDLSDLKITAHRIENMFYGFFDGYDYADLIHKSSELQEIAKEDTGLYLRIIDTCETIKNYPTEIN